MLLLLLGAVDLVEELLELDDGLADELLLLLLGAAVLADELLLLDEGLAVDVLLLLLGAVDLADELLLLDEGLVEELLVLDVPLGSVLVVADGLLLVPVLRLPLLLLLELLRSLLLFGV